MHSLSVRFHLSILRLYLLTPHLTYSPDLQAMHAMHATNKEVYLYPSMVKTALCLGF